MDFVNLRKFYRDTVVLLVLTVANAEPVITVYTQL